MQQKYKYTTKTYNGEKEYQRDLKKMSARGWEVVNAETVPIRRGCISTIFWVTLSVLTLGILPILVWLIIGRPVRIVVQYRQIVQP